MKEDKCHFTHQKLKLKNKVLAQTHIYFLFGKSQKLKPGLFVSYRRPLLGKIFSSSEIILQKIIYAYVFMELSNIGKCRKKQMLLKLTRKIKLNRKSSLQTLRS